MKLRNLRVAKVIGVKTLAGLLAVGLSLGTPLAALAAGEVSAAEQTAAESAPGSQRLQAKKVDGTEELVDIADHVLALLQSGEVRLNETTGYLEDAATGQKVNPETGERVESPSVTPEPPAEPEVPETPDPTETPENPDTPDNPAIPENPVTPGNPDTVPGTPAPDVPTAPETPKDPASDSQNPGQLTEDPAAPADSQENTSDLDYAEAIKAAEEADQANPDAAASNEELIARQQFVKLPEIVEDFRFWTVARKYAFAKAAVNIREEIPAGISGNSENPDETAQMDVEAAGREADALRAIYHIESDGEADSDSSGTDKANTGDTAADGSAADKIIADDPGAEKLTGYTAEHKINAESGILTGAAVESKTDVSEALTLYHESEPVKPGMEILSAPDSLPQSEAGIAAETTADAAASATAGQALIDIAAAVKQQAEMQKASVDAKLDAIQLSEQVRAVGRISRNGLLYVLREEENGWLYVESGGVRGFVKASEVYTGEAAQELLTVYQQQARKIAEDTGNEYTGIEGTVMTAEELVGALENRAYTHLRATVNQTVVEKVYALTNIQEGILNVREDPSEDARAVGILRPGNLCYILADQDSPWVYVESGDVRGFVKAEYLNFGEETARQVEESGEDAFGTAEESVAPEDNRALYYTLTSTKAGTPSGEIRQSMITYASQFIGNPYVWGGTSLTDGADCSGFVQQIYRAYGYELPRTAADQSQYGSKIAVEDAEPGDLIFYAKNGHIYHVVIYAGDGKTIEAANEQKGIVQGSVYAGDAVWAVRILDDQYTLAGAGISDVNATADMYGACLGNFTITYYCACEICCNKADGITATGTPVVEGQTIAVDPSVIPYGTRVIIGGHVFTAEDCGGAIKQNRIDVYVNSHAEALALGVTTADVYLVR